MVIALLVLIMGIVVIFTYTILSCDANPSDMGITLFACIILSALVGSILTIKCTSSEPTAMDVYKGKTTLEITYRDSIPVDSVVVFKNK